MLSAAALSLARSSGVRYASTAAGGAEVAPLFDKILIANRGEIACRVAKTARSMGIRTVAVFSEADANSLHVTMADEAVCIGPPPSSESYLVQDRILEAAMSTGAQAVHPGYGFLSENADFANACSSNGIEFIGPPPQAILSMGSKSESKRIMVDAGVPVVPGYHGDEQDVGLIREECAKIGYPVMLKAVMGGGGKGMRIVHSEKELEEAVAATRREAKSSFGDSRLIVEKYITRPRHIELQVFADKFGNTVHLFERDCSIQRRHQKVFEEAPAPGMDPAWRQQMGDAAVAAAKAVGYVGAGTVEFIVDENKEFYFMEMNTRLQVEHPVTELISRQDLVALQLSVASGRPLPFTQDDLAIHGHAIEARIYAEDPDNGFLPSTGRLVRCAPPETGDHVRVDTGVLQGDEISMHYDPMISKLIVWDQDRTSALRRLRKALSEYEVVGPTTNISFLKRIANHHAFESADNLTTGFIEEYSDDILVPDDSGAVAPPEAVALAALSLIKSEQASVPLANSANFDLNSPFNMPESHGSGAWRLNHTAKRTLAFDFNGEPVSVDVEYWDDGSFVMDLPGMGEAVVDGDVAEDGAVAARINNNFIKATSVIHDGEVHVFHEGVLSSFELPKPAFELEQDGASAGRLVSPLPGKIVKVIVNDGDEVEAGAPLVVLESMKVEHTISATASGKAVVACAVGDLVQKGSVLAHIDVESEA